MNALTLLVPGLLSPPVVPARLRELLPRPAALSTIVARADRDAFGAPGPMAALTALAGTTHLDVGALRAAAAGLGAGHWWCVDPVHLTADPDGLRLSVPEIDDDDAAFLAASLSQALEVDIKPLDGDHWVADLGRYDCGTTAVTDAFGARVESHLPRGPDAARLRQWINEAQMVLHEHPVNLRRADHGEAPVNTAWPWGGPASAPAPAWPFADSRAAEPAIAALGAGGPVPARFDDLPLDGATFVWIDTAWRAGRGGDPVGWVDAVSALERDWFAPAWDAVRHGRCSGLTVLDGAGTRLRLRRGHRWRWWRGGDFLEACDDAPED